MSEQQLEKALELKRNRDNADGITDTIVDEIKSSLVFKNNWEELLTGAPVALCCIGSCFIASGSSIAQTLNLTLPDPNTTVLKWGKLQPNLVDCATLGTRAFITAEEGMGGIKFQSKIIYTKLNNLVEVLGDPDSARASLRPQMTAIQKAADYCLDQAKEIDGKFDAWLVHASDLHAICVSQSAETEDKILTTALDKAVAQSRLTDSEAAMSIAKSATEKLEKQLEITGEAYKKASDEYPDGWDILGQQVASTFAETAANLLNQVIPTLVDNMTMTGKAKAVAGLFHGDKNESTENQSNSTGKTAPKQGSSQTQTQDTPNTDNDDPAYTSVTRDLNWFNLLNAILTGSEDGGMDWDKATGATTKSEEGSKQKAVGSSIGFVDNRLKDAVASFKKISTNKEPSKKYMMALNTAAKVSSEILAKVKESKSMSGKSLEAKSDTVQKWQEDFEAAYDAAIQLEATAKTFPGSVKGSIPLYAENPDVAIAKENAKSAQAQAVLKAAQDRLSTTQAAYTASMETYQKSTALLIEQQKALEAVKADLLRLADSSMKLASIQSIGEEIKKVLVQCIKLIATLKTQIVKLVRFFKAMSKSIEVVVKGCVNPFLDEVTAIVTNGASTTVYKVGSYSYTDIQRSQIFNSTLTIRAYFSVFADIAEMWLTVSKDHIFPGVELCDEMTSISDDPKEVKDRVRRLNEFSEKSQKAIKEICKEKRDEILGAMQARIEDVCNETKQLPPSASAAKAIETGVKEVQKATDAALEQTHEKSPLKINSSKFGSKVKV
ncbi:hypothetical protein AA313_de0208692 [Arthrobotrys entomopaga]|nr:hypothetical protein AA313_de0208692 [Arthrobotrys entomopaga]